MTERQRWVVAVRISDSFQTTIAEMVEVLGAGFLQSEAGAGAPPAGTAALLVLAGGDEASGIAQLAQMPAGVPRLVIGSAEDHRVAAAAIRQGAADYFALPGDLDLLRRTLERMLRETDATHQAEAFAAAERRAAGFDALVGRSPKLLQVVDQARRIAAHRDVTVLIGGETGTGKELLARAIHYHSPRAAAPFVEINCAAIPANLLESELFGHEKGAFTGAIAMKPGLFELAEGGTIFLDEVGNLPSDLQPKLLRALESREIRRVGGRETRAVDVRVVSATHVDLAAAARRGEFREDLYYRLHVVSLVLPPLRERGADVELLAQTFAVQLATAYGLPVPALTPDLRAALRAHTWPGNIRELRNAIERALVLSPPGVLELSDLFSAPAGPITGGLPFPAPLDTIIRAAVLAMLEQTGGNKSDTARRLGISRPRLQRILDGTSTDE
ncbi:MAG TPA: sigma-54 dependent transcriptional regulator [Gemmatimonadales bacterium]